MNDLIGKGEKSVASFMRKHSFCLVCYNEEEKIAEFAKTCAGITTERVLIKFSDKMRVKEIIRM